MIWLAPPLALVTTWITLTWLLRRERLPMDHPNDRSLHETPTPRVGGLGIMSGIITGSVLVADPTLLPVILAGLALAALSLIDDIRGLPVALRFAAHFLAAVGCLVAIGLSGWVLLAGTLAVLWMTNLYNFMDGSDGLAGGMTTIGFGTLAGAAGLAGENSLAALCGTISLAALAFLRYNFPPARIFMGDAGSIPLGLMAAAIGILGANRGVWPWLFPLVLFSPFIADASVTLVRRGLRGERVWRAHREHYYQRVVLMGVSHRHLALAAYALMLASAALALWLLTHPTHTIPVLGLWASAYLLIFLAIQRRWRVFGKSP